MISRTGAELRLNSVSVMARPDLLTATDSLALLQIETSEGGEGEPPLCAGCRIRIQDKYYLCAVEKKWHSSCLKCAECGAELENEASCFEKEGQIYCRDDYLRSVLEEGEENTNP